MMKNTMISKRNIQVTRNNKSRKHKLIRKITRNPNHETETQNKIKKNMKYKKQTLQNYVMKKIYI